ncbi:hypothetical protein ES288_A08G266100v1 [Gossypium darwinii]|uniref:Uncharacterized protein n=1 Tax=Gossypium darwinii TaxID=34276 RepID=A0A5D2FQR8_GOSDA|nr:hypothetical protein ES288_A08G266100v1 [Gossypium darwinii]
MEKKGILCFVVALLGIISAGAGFAAEVTRVKASQVTLELGECVYPRSPALVLSLISAATLLMGQIIINFSTGCFCCKRNNAQSHSSNWTKALCFYIVSWITFMTAIGLLLTGAALNDRRGEQVYKDGGIYCYVIKPGVFAIGAVLSALSSIFGVFYYQTLNSKAKDASNAPIPNQGGIVTAQPQFPSENPGFVNGDAYNKRQFN